MFPTQENKCARIRLKRKKKEKFHLYYLRPYLQMYIELWILLKVILNSGHFFVSQVSYNKVYWTKMWPLIITSPDSASWSFSWWLYLQPPLPCLADPRAHTEGIHHVPLHFPLLREWEEAEGLKSISQTWLTLPTMLICAMDSRGVEHPTQASSMQLCVHCPTHQRTI